MVYPEDNTAQSQEQVPMPAEQRLVLADSAIGPDSSTAVSAEPTNHTERDMASSQNDEDSEVSTFCNQSPEQSPRMVESHPSLSERAEASDTSKNGNEQPMDSQKEESGQTSTAVETRPLSTKGAAFDDKTETDSEKRCDFKEQRPQFQETTTLEDAEKKEAGKDSHTPPGQPSTAPEPRPPSDKAQENANAESEGDAKGFDQNCSFSGHGLGAQSQTAREGVSEEDPNISPDVSSLRDSQPKPAETGSCTEETAVSNEGTQPLSLTRLPLGESVCQCVCLPVYLFVCLSASPSAYLNVCTPLSLSLSPPLSLSLT